MPRPLSLRILLVSLLFGASQWPQPSEDAARLKAICQGSADLTQCEQQGVVLAAKVREGDPPERREAVAGALGAILQLERREHPPVTENYARIQFLYGWMELNLGNLKEAEAGFAEAKAALEKLQGPDHPGNAECLVNLAEVYITQNRNEVAEQLLLRARRMRDPKSLDSAYILQDLAYLYEAEERFQEAESFLLEAVAIRKGKLGETHPVTLSSLSNLAELHDEMGLYRTAEKQYRETLAAAEKSAPDSDLVGTLVNNLAELYHSKGLYAEAEPKYRRAFDLVKKTKGARGLDAATCIDNLAGLYNAEGDFARSEQQHLLALDIRRSKLDKNHPAIALSLNNLGSVCSNRRDYAKAAAYYRESLAIRRMQPQPVPSDIAQALDNLGELFARQGAYDETERFYLQALPYRAKAPKEDTGRSLYHLAEVYQMRGQYARAEPYYAGALALLEPALGPDHPDTVFCRTEYARDLWRIRKDSPARDQLLAANRGVTEFWSHNLLALDEAKRRSLVARFDYLMSLSLTVAADLYGEDAAGATALAALTIATRKGIRSSAAQEVFAQIRRDRNPASVELFGQLRANAAQQSSASRKSGPDAARKLDALHQKEREIEQRLFASSAGYRAWGNPVEPDQVAAHLSADSAFIDVVRYLHDGGKSPEMRYAALVYRAGRAPKLVMLGPAAAIDKGVDNLHLNFENMWTCTSAGPCNGKVLIGGRQFENNLANTEADCASLYRLTMAKLRKAIGDARQLIVSPDAKLAEMPWEILRSDQGRYLIEDGYRIRYLDSARSLVYPPPHVQPRTQAVAIAKVDYDGDRPIASLAPDAPHLEREAEERPAGGPVGTWKPLNGGEEILQTLGDLRDKLGPVRKLPLGSEEEVMALQQPAAVFAHTHGFFRPNSSAAGDGLDSGIVLYGANRTSDPEGKRRDGWLLAKEVMLLNLEGTRLVALLGCDTGRGTEAGEGVQGLRHALAVAGARSTLLTLWEVGDLSAARFLRELLVRSVSGGRQTLEGALAETQIAFLRGDVREPKATATSNRWRHPYFWAAPTLAGEGGILNLGAALK